MHHNEDGSANESDAAKYTPADNEKKIEGLHSLSNKVFGVKCRADIILDVCREASKRLYQKLLTLIYAPSLIASDYKLKLRSNSK